MNCKWCGIGVYAWDGTTHACDPQRVHDRAIEPYRQAALDMAGLYRDMEAKRDEALRIACAVSNDAERALREAGLL